MPSSSPSTSCTAASARSLPLSARKPASDVTSEVANSAMGCTFALMASTRLFSNPMATGSSFISSPGSLPASALTTCVTASDTMGSAPSISPTTSVSVLSTTRRKPSSMPGSSSGVTPSCNARETSAMAVVAASTSGWNAGISVSPMAFFSPSLLCFTRCILSSKEPMAASASSLKTTPICAASALMPLKAALPASMSGFSSRALSPNRDIASASRSAPASMLCSASIASQNTSSVPRIFPSKSLIDTPNWTKFLYAEPLLSAKPSAMCLDKSFMLSLTRSTDVSTKLLA